MPGLGVSPPCGHPTGNGIVYMFLFPVELPVSMAITGVSATAMLN